jgi:hypothetical protein
LFLDFPFSSSFLILCLASAPFSWALDLTPPVLSSDLAFFAACHGIHTCYKIMWAFTPVHHKQNNFIKKKKHHCSSKFRHQCVKMSFASDNVFLLTSSALQFTGPSCFAQVKSCYNNHVTGNSDLMVMISHGHCVSNGLPLL